MKRRHTLTRSGMMIGAAAKARPVAASRAPEFHQSIGKARVAQRIWAINRQIKVGSASMRHATPHTPLSADLSAGIVCFEFAGMNLRAVVP